MASSKALDRYGTDSLTLRIAHYTILFIILAAVVVPFIVIVNVSLKSTEEYASTALMAIPESLYLANYSLVLTADNLIMLTGFLNTFLLIAISVSLNIVIGTMATYVLTRFDFKLRGFILLLFVLSVLFPKETTHVATFTVIKFLGIFNTRAAGVALYTGTDIIQLMIFMQFIATIPFSIDESARMDGAGYLTIFTRMIIPLMKPAIVTVIIIKSVWIYNDLFVPLLYMPRGSLKMVTTALVALGEDGGTAGGMTNWPVMGAAVIVAVIPTLILYVFFQREIIAGLSEGSTKY
jgi:multiple sugar transport system permease protein